MTDKINHHLDLYNVTNVAPFDTTGLITFTRTYARRLNEDDPNSKVESWQQTLIRVVEACNDQLKADFSDEEKQELFNLLYNLKCSVAGRFLWQLGTRTVDKLGIPSLQNCCTCVIDEPIRPFTWAMNFLMLGAGVGYRILPEDVEKLPIVKPIKLTRQDTKDADFIVPDSREGWVKLLGKLLKAHFYSGTDFSYSTMLLRSKGAPIRGFGGLSSGPEVLCEGIAKINNVLNSRSGQKMRPVDCLDVMNIIGMIVVSGNVRRCLPKDALVHTDKGLIPIQNIEKGTNVLTSKGYYPVKAVFVQGDQQLIKINTQNGFFTCTKSHKMAVKDSDSYVWKQASDLTTQDQLITSTEAIKGKTTELPTSKTLSIPRLDEDCAWFIGLYQGQDCFNETICMNFPVHRYNIARKAKTILQRFHTDVYLERTDDNYILTANSQVSRYFTQFSIFVPKCVLEGTISVRQAYISGLSENFVYPSVLQTHYSSLAKAVQTLLYSCGLQSNLCFDGKYNIRIITIQPDNKFYLNQVVSIENHDVDATFDIEVDQVHEFYCNGYLTHNSAQIAIGDCKDSVYLNAKNWGNGNIPNWRAFSNNSVVCNDIADILDNEQFWQGYQGNGEPYGLINLKLSQKCGRIGETQYPDKDVVGYNPCVSGDTLIAVADGRNAVSIRQLAEEGKDVPVYSINPTSKEISIQWGRNPRITGENMKLYRIHFSGQNEYIDVTENHKFYTTDGRTLLANELIQGDKLPTFDASNLNTSETTTIHSIEELPNNHFVYNITVDNTHTYGVVTNTNTNKGIYTANCGEQSLNNYESCCLSELYLPNIKSKEELFKSAKYMYRICKHSLTLPCDSKETESIVHKNMRMGIGVTGYLQATEEQRSWLSECYEYLRSYDKEYSAKHNFPTSIKLTTVKPSGCARADSLIQTNQGLLRLDEIGDIHGQEWQNLSNLEVLSDKNTTHTIKKFYVNGKVPTKLIKTEDGIEIEVSHKHRFRVIENKQYVWKRSTELKVGHKLAIVLGGQPENNKPIRFAVDNHFSVADKDMARLFGYIYGCCSVKEDSLIYEPESVVGNLIKAKFGNMNSVQVLTILRKYGYNPEIIPKFIRQSNIDVVNEFVSTIVNYTLSSENLAQQVISLARNCGKSYSLEQNTTYSFCENVRPDNHNQFYLDKIVSVTDSECNTYDIEVDAVHHYRMFGVISHNTLSLLAGCTSGVHPGFARYYKRRIRIASESPLLKIVREYGYPIEYVQNFDGTLDHSTQIITFPYTLPENTVLAENCSAIDQLEWVKKVQSEWSDNAVSVTVYYRKHELPLIKEWLKNNYNDNIKTVSFLLHSDHGFIQAPLEQINKEQYDELKAKCRPISNVDIEYMQESDELLSAVECAGGVCPIK